MQTSIIILEVIINYLQTKNTFIHISKDYDVITFFDINFPYGLKKYSYRIPIIYYSGDIRKINQICGVIISHSPSFYAQKTINKIRRRNNILGVVSNANSMTKTIDLYDIIYCDYLGEIKIASDKLYFCFGNVFSKNEQLQLLSILLHEIYVIEGYVNEASIGFITNCLENEVEILALPSNIYITVAQLPNKVLKMGIEPITLNKIKRLKCKN